MTRVVPATVVAGGLMAAALVGCGSSDYEAIDDASRPDGQQTEGDRGDGAGTGSVDDTFAGPGEVEGFESVAFVEVEPADDRSDAALDPAPLHDESVEVIIEQVTLDLRADVERGDGADEALAAVEPIDQAARPATDRDGRARNELGELAVLDAGANLACANVEIGLGAIDDGRDGEAGDRLATAAQAAADSDLDDVAEWSDRLGGMAPDWSTEDLATLIGFLSVCTEGGYEL